MTEINGNLTLEELYAAANEMSLRWWGVPYTGEIELVNRDWRRMGGCFLWRKKPERTGKIRLSRKVNAGRTRDEVLGTLLHELVHWRLFMTEVPCSDQDPEFVAEAIRVGAPISWTNAARAACERYIKSVEAAG